MTIRAPTSIFIAVASLVGLVAVAPAARADVFHITYEAAGVQSADSTALCANLGNGSCTLGTETFDARTSKSAFDTDFGTANVIKGSYSSVQINVADQYGGAGGTGKYAVAFSTTPYTVSLTTTLASGINYFGFWLSALDGGNQVSFYKGAVEVYTFTPKDLIAALGSCATANAYCKNPTTNFLGKNNQLYAFVNFFDTNGTFDSVHFTESPADGGYESDNHTVGFVTAETGTAVPVPEPYSIVLLGMSLLGLTYVRRRRV